MTHDLLTLIVSAVPTRLFRMADLALNGRLAEILAAWRCEGQSFERIAHNLAVLYGVEVRSESVRRWCVDLGIHEPERESVA